MPEFSWRHALTVWPTLFSNGCRHPAKSWPESTPVPIRCRGAIYGYCRKGAELPPNAAAFAELRPEKAAAKIFASGAGFAQSKRCVRNIYCKMLRARRALLGRRKRAPRHEHRRNRAAPWYCPPAAAEDAKQHLSLPPGGPGPSIQIVAAVPVRYG